MGKFIDEYLVVACGLVATEAILRGHDPEEVIREFEKHYSSIYDDENLFDVFALAAEACFDTLPKLKEHLGIFDTNRDAAIYTVSILSTTVTNFDETGQERGMLEGHHFKYNEAPIENVKESVQEILLKYSVLLMFGEISISQVHSLQKNNPN